MRVPAEALVLLIGAAGSGKSTFAARWFPDEAIVSSDRLRLRQPPGGKSRRNDVFETLRATVETRLSSPTLTVVDATNTDWLRRSDLIKLAHDRGRPVIGLVFALPLEECLAQNRSRSDPVPAGVIRRQAAAVTRDLDRFDLEGFSAVHLLRSRADIDQLAVEVERGPEARASLTKTD